VCLLHRPRQPRSLALRGRPSALTGPSVAGAVTGTPRHALTGYLADRRRRVAPYDSRLSKGESADSLSKSALRGWPIVIVP
jgi:hypothetical protein